MQRLCPAGCDCELRGISLDYSPAGGPGCDRGRSTWRALPSGACSEGLDNLRIGDDAIIDGDFVDDAVEEIGHATSLGSDRDRRPVCGQNEVSIQEVRLDDSSIDEGPHFDVGGVNLTESAGEMVEPSCGWDTGLRK